MCAHCTAAVPPRQSENARNQSATKRLLVRILKISANRKTTGRPRDPHPAGRQNTVQVGRRGITRKVEIGRKNDLVRTLRF